MSLREDVQLHLLIIRNPVPLSILSNSRASKRLVTSLKRTLTSLDKHLINLFHAKCTSVAPEFAAQLALGPLQRREDLMRVRDLSPRAYQLFPALYDAGMLQVTHEI